MKLSVLIFDSSTSYDLNDIFNMAIKAEECGFERFWLGEHYDIKSIWNNPEPLIPVILGLTEKINVGAAGILLKLHSTLRVASSFKLINAMYPGRVDLGFAGGFTSDNASKLLKESGVFAKKNDFYELVEEIFNLYEDEEKWYNNGVFINPPFFPRPNLWLLSLGFERTNKAIDFGLNYSKAMFHKFSNDNLANEELKRFSERFFLKHSRLPEINIAFSGVLTKTEQEAVVERKRHKNMKKGFKTNIIGTPDYFKEKILNYKEFFNVNDFTFLDNTVGMKRRIENLEILKDLLPEITSNK